MAQPADSAALESLPHVQMPLDGAPLDEARLGIGEDLEIFFVTNTFIRKRDQKPTGRYKCPKLSHGKKTF